MDYHHQEFKIFSGNANKELAREMARLMNVELGKADVGKFSNGETSVMIHESIRSMDVYIIQPTCANNGDLPLSVNDSLMELLVMADAFKRASCRRLVAVVPFFGYARQSKKHKSRTPITAKLIANMMEKAGFDRVITMDLHASQIQGFFDIPVDNLFAEPLIVKYIKKRISGDKVVVAPGVGGVKRAKLVADRLDCDLVILHKQYIRHDYHSSRPHSPASAHPGQDSNAADDASPSSSARPDGVGVNINYMTLVGDVQDKVALIIDDIADTCETLQLATQTLLAKGAKQVYALVSHGVLSGGAMDRIKNMPLTELVITNSIPNDDKTKACDKIKVINIAPMLAEAIRRTHYGESLSSFFAVQY
jgi:ribose-phosphate pyrophosphokinase